MTHRRHPSTLIGRTALLVLAGLSMMTPVQTTFAQDAAKPKLLVLTDIGGDPDDQQAMVRLMTYNNEFEVVGLIASSNLGHGQTTQPGLINNIVNAYGQGYANLSTHASGYAPASQLLSVVKSGTPVYNPSNLSQVIGDGKSTAGSNHIISVVDAAADGRPVNVSIWGGAADLAQALYDVRATRTTQQLEQFVSRLRAYASYDQDGTGAWINTNFPQLSYILSADVKVGSTTLGQSASIRGIYQNNTRANNGTSGRQLVPTDQLGLTKRAWVDANVRGHGALGDQYPVTGIWQGPTGGNFPHNSATEGLKEGDTPTWLYFLPNGLNVPDQPGFGGWGGRYQQPNVNQALFLTARDKHYSGNTDYPLEAAWTVARWRQAMQNDFAARMDWVTAATYGQANHAPVSPLEGLYTYTELTVGDDQQLTLPGVAAGWTDPDGDALSYRWWFYADPSTPGVVPTLGDVTAVDLQLTLPEVTAVSQLHLILEVTDQPTSGGVTLTRYQRVVLTIDPNHVPEPTTLASLGLAGAMLLFRGRGHFRGRGRGRGRESINRSGKPRC